MLSPQTVKSTGSSITGSGSIDSEQRTELAIRIKKIVAIFKSDIPKQ